MEFARMLRTPSAASSAPPYTTIAALTLYFCIVSCRFSAGGVGAASALQKHERLCPVSRVRNFVLCCRAGGFAIAKHSLVRIVTIIPFCLGFINA